MIYAKNESGIIFVMCDSRVVDPRGDHMPDGGCLIVGIGPGLGIRLLRSRLDQHGWCCIRWDGELVDICPACLRHIAPFENDKGEMQAGFSLDDMLARYAEWRAS